MDTLVKSLLYIGTVLTLGAGIFGWFLGPDLMQGAVRRCARYGLLLGAAMVLIGSPLQIVVTVSNLLGYFDPTFGREYLLATRHGSAALFRLITVGLVIAVTLIPMRREIGRALFVVFSLLLLGSFSWTSHAVSVGGNLPLFADLLHFGAAALWAGAVLYTAWLPLWDGNVGSHVVGQPLVTAVDRVSGIGLACVCLLILTGIYTALLHVGTPEILTTSPYGRALSLKNLLVLVIVGIAAANRWWFLPGLRCGRQQRSFSRLFRIEAILLLGVLALTGLLTTSPLPHETGVAPDPWENLQNFLPPKGD